MAVLVMMVKLYSRAPLGTSTLVETPLDAVRADDRRTRLALAGAAPTKALAGVPFHVPVRVSNAGTATWPVLSVASRRVVELVYRWQDESGRELSAGAGPLPYDLVPSQSMVTTLGVRPPAATGAALLTIGVGQAGSWFEGSPPAIAVTLVTR